MDLLINHLPLTSFNIKYRSFSPEVGVIRKALMDETLTLVLAKV